MKTNLLEKYNQKVPRYTSYPPVPYWNEVPEESKWFQSIATNLDTGGGVDLYIHIPFCFKLCWYCGCNRVVSKNQGQASDYVATLLKEWYMYQKGVTGLKINSIHFGGGTPNFLPASDLEELLGTLSFYTNENFIGSIEVDPRTLSNEQLDVLKKYKFSRISMGIQDFDPKVQQAINREQSVDLVKGLVDKIREMGFESLNFDLIYGLPKQGSESIISTITKVAELEPDLIALYSYAHLPQVLKNQRLINEGDLPDPETKRSLYNLSKELLIKNNYIEVGLDHFARKDSYLGKAFLANTLKRSFMGYTDKKSSCLIGLGVSAISNTPDMYVQNKKDLTAYYSDISEERLSFNIGHSLSNEDKLSEKIIQSIMCSKSADLTELKNQTYYNEIKDKLELMQADGLITFEKQQLEVTIEGEMFLRNIAQVFDLYAMKSSGENRFSQSV